MSMADDAKLYRAMKAVKPGDFVVTYRTGGKTTVMVLDSNKIDPWAAMNTMQARLFPGVTAEAKAADRLRADRILQRAREEA